MKKRALILFLILMCLAAAAVSVRAQDNAIELTDSPEFSDEVRDPAPEPVPTETPYAPSGDDNGLVFMPITYDDGDDSKFADDSSYGNVPTEAPVDEIPEIDLENITEADALADPYLLLKVADEMFFPRVGYSETFWETQGYLNEVLEGGIIHQYYVRGGVASDLLMSMFPAERSALTGDKWLNFRKDWERDYHVSVTMRRGEDIPIGSGGCWLRYSNVRTKSYGSESGLILFPERDACSFEPVGNHEDLIYTPVASLAGLRLNNAIRFDFIRLDGISYVYADGRYLFSFEDGFDGKMSFEGGAELYVGGNRVRCDFDDFTMRYR